MLKNNFMSLQELEAQENLSLDLLKKIKPDILVSQEILDNRPTSSFQEVMSWAEKNFACHLSDAKNLNKFVHNRIIVDGAFVKYCQENKTQITTIFKDSIISWKTDSGQEKYFIQGGFLIKNQNLEFLHFATWHKGNQNEDEVSFFVIVSESNYSKYLDFRNNFDNWCEARDRSSCFIRVAGGEDIPYETNNSWNDLFLPQDTKEQIKNFVENFLSSKDWYAQHKIPWKTGAILWGKPGCGKTSIIKTIISNYNFKPVTIVPTADDNCVRESFSYAEEQSPSLLYFEDLDSLLERNIDLSSFLNLMDGIVSKNGIMVIATANEFEKLKPSITDRPSRFDRKFEISLPDQKMAYIYLSRWFGKTISAAKLQSLAKTAVQYHFSYAYLKELYISSMFEALSKNRKVSTEKDIDSSMKRLIKDKNLNKKINTNRYI